MKLVAPVAFSVADKPEQMVGLLMPMAGSARMLTVRVMEVVAVPFRPSRVIV